MRIKNIKDGKNYYQGPHYNQLILGKILDRQKTKANKSINILRTKSILNFFFSLKKEKIS